MAKVKEVPMNALFEKADKLGWGWTRNTGMYFCGPITPFGINVVGQGKTLEEAVEKGLENINATESTKA